MGYVKPKNGPSRKRRDLCILDSAPLAGQERLSKMESLTLTLRHHPIGPLRRLRVEESGNEVVLCHRPMPT